MEKFMSNTADVIIIGGGIHGVSLAFHLAERGVTPLVLEKNFIAAGATGRSSGMVRMHYDVRQDSELAWVSFGYFRNWAERVGGDCGFTRTGFIQLVARKHEAALRRNTAMQQDIGIPTFLITADDVKRLAPAFLTDDFDVAAYEPESGYADPSATAASFVTAAKENAHIPG
jgi:sarcosine oxidase subunit beta